MGFEILYKYHEKLEDGGYNKEEEKEMKRKVGKAYDDVPLSKLAVSVLGQLARRDIWVTDVEVYEYKKQKISFRESKNGIVIKNKKFSYDTADGAELIEEDEYTQPQQMMVYPHQKPQVHQNGAMVPVDPTKPEASLKNLRPVKIVEVDPDVAVVREIEQKKLKFTVGKKYPVYKVKEGLTLGTWIYSMIDDLGRDIHDIQDKYFCAPNAVYVNDNAIDGFENGKENAPKLMFEGERDDGMPDLSKIRG